jgi:hypothetical protein
MHNCLLKAEIKQQSQETLPAPLRSRRQRQPMNFPSGKPGVRTRGGKVNGSSRSWLFSFSSGFRHFPNVFSRPGQSLSKVWVKEVKAERSALPTSLRSSQGAYCVFFPEVSPGCSDKQTCLVRISAGATAQSLCPGPGPVKRDLRNSSPVL